MAVGHNQKIWQIVGYENRGKTTVTEQLIRALSDAQLRVGTIKHHAHGQPDAPSDKDSTRHERAGAVISAVEGGGIVRFAVHDATWQLQQLVALYATFPLDIILIEGYKTAHYPKVVIIGSPEDLSLLQLPNIRAVLYWPACANEKWPHPHFSIHEPEHYLSYLLQEMRE